MTTHVMPEFVTFTGPDDLVDVDRMVAISVRAPVEWGILFSRRRQGMGRYPSLGLLPKLASPGLRLAAHVCGSYAEEIVATGACLELEALLANSGLRFSRFQINTTLPLDTRLLASFATRMSGARAIAQCRDIFPDDPSIDWLHDVSAGEGIVPAARPVPEQGIFGGYAGGLGPDNVAAQLAAIRRTHPAEERFWIDMETKVRTDDVFDLDKVEAVLDAVYPPFTPAPYCGS